MEENKHLLLSHVLMLHTLIPWWNSQSRKQSSFELRTSQKIYWPKTPQRSRSVSERSQLLLLPLH